MTKFAAVIPARAVALYKNGWTVGDIAHEFGVKKPCVYRAFKRAGFETPGMTEYRNKAPREFMPPTGPQADPLNPRHVRFDADAEERAIAAMRIAPRDPCFRCGTRGDIGCGCTKAPIGWRAG